jgi:hypothetical protein
MANTVSTRRTTMICRPSAGIFALNRDEQASMSLLRHAQDMWPMTADEPCSAQSEASFMSIENHSKGSL